MQLLKCHGRILEGHSAATLIPVRITERDLRCGPCSAVTPLTQQVVRHNSFAKFCGGEIIAATAAVDMQGLQEDILDEVSFVNMIGYN